MRCSRRSRAHCLPLRRRRDLPGPTDKGRIEKPRDVATRRRKCRTSTTGPPYSALPMSNRLGIAIAALGAVPFSHVMAQPQQQLSKELIAARVDSMVQAYMAEKGPASMSVAIS